MYLWCTEAGCSGVGSINVIGISRQLRLRGRAHIPCEMEPGEKFIRRLLKFMILAFVVAIVFGEFSFGMRWLGAAIFIIGASMGAQPIYLVKDLKN
jgi:hypothetical protein